VTTTHTNTVVVGGGQAGLALSRCLTGLGVEHVVLEAGRVAQRWHERWDSLRLLTPNWMTRLPGWAYQGPDPDGFMTAGETAAFFAAYARSFAAPVLERTPVERVRQHGDRFTVEANGVTFGARNVVAATGWCDQPAVPAAARHLSGAVTRITADAYRRPGDLPEGGCWSSGPRPPGCSWPTSCTAAAGPSPWPSALTPACPGATGGGTPSGGSTARARSTTRSTTAPTR